MTGHEVLAVFFLKAGQNSPHLLFCRIFWHGARRYLDGFEVADKLIKLGQRGMATEAHAVVAATLAHAHNLVENIILFTLQCPPGTD